MSRRRLLVVGGSVIAAAVVGLRPISPPPPLPGVDVTEDSAFIPGFSHHAPIWIPAGKKPAPLIIFSHGSGQRPRDYSVFLRSLAGQGYVIVALPHDHSFDTLALHLAAPRMGDDVVMAAGWALSQANPYRALIDTSRMAAVGHSVGGAAAAFACLRDGRFKAGVDLDGSMYGEVIHRGIHQPFLLYFAALPLMSRLETPRFYEERDQARLHEDSFMVHSPRATFTTVRNLDHMSFTDGGLASTRGDRAMERMALRLSPVRAQRGAVVAVREFLDASFGARR